MEALLASIFDAVTRGDGFFDYTARQSMAALLPKTSA
jgi:hypothetical protein